MDFSEEYIARLNESLQKLRGDLHDDQLREVKTEMEILNRRVHVLGQQCLAISLLLGSLIILACVAIMNS